MSEVTYDVMVDLETYSELPIAAIASIGAVRFNVATKEVIDPFYVTIDPKSCKEYGLHFSKKTLDWWLKQPLEVREALRKDNITLPRAINEFSEWLGGDFGNICCWGMFDVPILQYAYYVVGSHEPWNFYETTECRSVSDLIGDKIVRDKTKHHNALEDAIAQAKHIIEILNKE